MYLVEGPVDVAGVESLVRRDSDGAVVLFAGYVRNHHRGRAVESIFYEAYESMAEKEIGRIEADVRAEWPDVCVAVRHGLGRISVGECSIVIACSSPHRAEAFEASRAMIDRIKKTVPIWKKERGPDGEEWVGWQWT